MAIARDQTPAGSVTASGTTVTLTWGTNPVAGAKVLVFVYSSVTVTSVQDNGSTVTTFTGDLNNAGSSGWAYIYRGDNIRLPSSGSYAVTVTFSATASTILLAGRSYTGVASGAPAATGTTSGSSSTPSSGSATPTTANSLVAGFFVDGASASETITLTTSGANSVYSSSAGTVVDGAAADNIPAATTSQSIAWSLSATQSWGGLVAVYSPAGTTAPVAAQPLTPPGIFSPMAFRRQALPSAAPVLATAADSGTGSDTVARAPGAPFTASAVPGRARPGQAQPGNPGSPGTQAVTGSQVPYKLLVPPGFSPVSFQRQAFPSHAPALAPAGDTGTGTDTGTVGVSDSDTGSGAEASVTGVSGSDAGAGADTGGVPGAAFPLIPPGLSSPAAFRFQGWPSAAPPGIPSADTGTGADTGAVTASVSDSDTGTGADSATVGVSGAETGSGADIGEGSAVGTRVQPLIPPGLVSPMAFQGQRWPSQAPLEAASQDAGTGADSSSLTADVSDSDAGSGAESSSLTASVADSDTGTGADTAGVTIIGAPPPPTSAVLVPPAPFTPMTFQRQAWPSSAPLLTTTQDTGSGGDSGQPEVSGADAGTGTDAAQVSPTGTDTGAGADTATVGVSDADAGSAADTATAGISGADTGSGTESSQQGPPVQAFPLVPPGRMSPMALGWQAFPAGAPLQVLGQDTGAGADGSTLAVTDPDTGTGAESATVTVSGADTGSGAESSLGGPPVQAFPLTPPGLVSPMAFQRQQWPSAAPALAPSGDAGTGADTGAPTAAVSGSDAGTGADTAAAGLLPAAGLPGIPPGFMSPMAFRFQSWPTTAPAQQSASPADTGTAADSAVITVSGSDTGAGADAAWGVPVTGAGTVQRLNPVRESMTGLGVSVHMSTALGAILRFASHGSERLYVLAQTPGVTLTVTDGGMVLDQAAQQFPAVTLQAGMLYCFGPFHSVLAIPGSNVMQVILSTTYGVQVVVVQGPDAH